MRTEVGLEHTWDWDRERKCDVWPVPVASTRNSPGKERASLDICLQGRTSRRVVTE